ncbi:hypothetical protein LCGC14_2466820, partial [marine sediment metagenome]
ALAAIGKYADVQFIWDDSQSANLLFSVPYTDVDGTALAQKTLYINLATLFAVTAAGTEDPPVGTAVNVARESHSGAFTAVAALTAAQAKALKMRSVVWVDADPTGGSGLVGSLAGHPGTWVIVFPALFGVADGTLGGHAGAQSVTTTGQMGEITAAELAGVNRLTVNFVQSGAGSGAASGIYTIQGSRNTYLINLTEFIIDNEIDADCH